jgi:Polyketide cyclase / dehydrase and lipid transport
MSQKYTFVDHWYIKAPMDQVFRHIADTRTYPHWWPVYPKVEVLRLVDDTPVVTRLTVKSVFAYRLILDAETVEARPPTLLRTVARGQLIGTGDWVFNQDGDTTHAEWTWIVSSNHPLLNLLEPIMKPMFAWSHKDASQKGHRGLKRFLE